MNHYKVRVSSQPSPKDERWMILENGITLKKRTPKIEINVPCYTEEDMEEEDRLDEDGNIFKIVKCRFYIVCYGVGTWRDNIFVISEA